jgi:hypothetical protein
VIALAALALVAPGPALMLVPAAILAVLLLRGMFPGEKVIERLARAVRRRVTRPVSIQLPRARALALHRVGRLIAFALAMRPPPAVATQAI